MFHLNLLCSSFSRPYTYQQHVKCITENQKYGSKNYVEKEAKGEMKQNAWCEQVERAIEFVKDPRLRSLLENIQGYSNIPRKEAKFINFLTNSCRIRDEALCRRAWKAIADEAEKLKKEQEESKATEKIEEAAPSTKSQQNGANGAVECNNNEVKKLRKAVINAYKEVIGDEEGVEELFESKLAKSGVSINGKIGFTSVLTLML
ncbi:LYAR-type C2HC zinc finger [Cooperia oncophora]